jgi:hypothetical protein
MLGVMLTCEFYTKGVISWGVHVITSGDLRYIEVLSPPTDEVIKLENLSIKVNVNLIVCPEMQKSGSFYYLDE